MHLLNCMCDCMHSCMELFRYSETHLQPNLVWRQDVAAIESSSTHLQPNLVWRQDLAAIESSSSLEKSPKLVN